MAEREGFEPPIGLHLCRISSAVHSTTLPPLLKAPNQAEAVRGRGRVLGEDSGPDKHVTDKIGGRNPGCGGKKVGTAIRETDWRSHAAKTDPEGCGFGAKHLRHGQASDGTEDD